MVKTQIYNDRVYGKVELTHIETITENTEEVERIDEIWEYPSGDFRVLTTLNWLKVKTEPFHQEFFFKKDWMRAIFQFKMPKE